MQTQQVSHDMTDLESLLRSLSAAEAVESDPVVDAILAEKELEDAELMADDAALTEELDECLLADLEAATARAEVYEAQEATTDPTAVAPTATPAAAPKTKRAPKAAGATSTPRTPRKALTDLDEGVFQRALGDTVDATSKSVTISLRPAQVKVAEKFDNLFLAIANSKLPSSYVVTAVKTLQQTGTMTSADLVGAYKAAGLKEGTARSQTGQIMELFNVVGIANRSGQSLTVRQDSTVLVRLNTIINATPVAA